MYKSLRLEVTGACNLSCIYCHASRLNTADIKKDELSTDRKLEIVNEGKELGCNENTLIGGEPFVSKDLEVIVNECGESSVVNITTNGHFFTEKNIAWLKKYPQIKEFRVSLDGLLSHNFVRSGSSYEVVISALKRVLRVFPEKRIVVQTTCNKQNLSELLELYSILKDIGVFRWRISQLWRFGRTKGNEGILEFADYDDMFVVYKQLIKNFHNDGKPFNLGIYNVYNSQITVEDYVAMDLNTHPCTYHFRSICVKANGELTFCPALDLPFSSVKKQSLKEALQSRWLQQFKEIKISDVHCGNCRYIKLCGGGCRADAYAWLGDIRQLDPIACCLMVRVEKEIVPILSSQERVKYRELIDENGEMPPVIGKNAEDALKSWEGYKTRV
ncbi:MAG: radical SAM protein [Bacteroidales bacterium]